MIFSIPKPSPKLPVRNESNVSIAKTTVPPVIPPSTITNETKILTKILNSESSTFMMLKSINTSNSSCCGGFKA